MGRFDTMAVIRTPKTQAQSVTGEEARVLLMTPVRRSRRLQKKDDPQAGKNIIVKDNNMLI